MMMTRAPKPFIGPFQYIGYSLLNFARSAIAIQHNPYCFGGYPCLFGNVNRLYFSHIQHGFYLMKCHFFIFIINLYLSFNIHITKVKTICQEKNAGSNLFFCIFNNKNYKYVIKLMILTWFKLFQTWFKLGSNCFKLGSN